MKKLFIIFILSVFIFWPQVQGPAQSTPPSPSERAGVRLKLTDSIAHLNKKIESKFDSITSEINRIANRPARYITRTHVRKVNHYRIDTVLVFIDTCFNQPQIDTAYLMPEIKPEPPKRTWLKRLLHPKKKPRENYLKIVDQ